MKQTDPTREQKCRELTELNGGCWHEFLSAHDMGNRCSCRCICGNLDEHIKANNPSYPDAKSILEVMMKRGDCDLFIEILSDKCRFWGWVPETFLTRFISKYIINFENLLTEAVEWSKEIR